MTCDTIEVWIAMNEAGDYEVAKDEDSVVDAWNENIGGLCRRLVKLRVTMSPPAVTHRRNSGFLLVFYLLRTARCEIRHDEHHKCALTARPACLLGRAERSSPKAAQRRAAGAAVIASGLYHSIGVREVIPRVHGKE
jgi:hypothetical protein